MTLRTRRALRAALAGADPSTDFAAEFRRRPRPRTLMHPASAAFSLVVLVAAGGVWSSTAAWRGADPVCQSHPRLYSPSTPTELLIELRSTTLRRC